MTAGAYMDDGFNAPSYPTAFGITFTPKVIGALTAIGGLAVAGFVGFKMVGPQIEAAQTLKENIANKELQLDQRTSQIAQRNEIVIELNKAKTKQQEVLGLFSSQKALDTLLLDINRVISTSQASLSKFTPNYDLSGVVSDGSLGPELNFKLKRQVTDIGFTGTFAQSLSIMQAIDKLQTVLVIQDLNMEIVKNKDNLGEPEVKSTFKLYAYVPLTAEEMRAAEQQQQAPEGTPQ